MKEEKVYSVEEVIALAEDKRSVYIAGLDRVMPAAALQNWNAKTLYDAIKKGVVFRYIKGTKPYKKEVRKRHKWVVSTAGSTMECVKCGCVCDKSGYRTLYIIGERKYPYSPDCIN